MSDTNSLISALGSAPGVIIPLIREVPAEILKRRPAPAKWSAYEHAIHLSQSDVSFLARLDLILSKPEPVIETIYNSEEDEAGVTGGRSRRKLRTLCPRTCRSRRTARKTHARRMAQDRSS